MLGVLLVLTYVSFAQTPSTVPADQPIPRSDQNSLTTHARARSAFFSRWVFSPKKNTIAVRPTKKKITKNQSKRGGGKLLYLNIKAKRAGGAGSLCDGMLNADNLHPAVKGYQVWADAL